jgi:hypothetical protein
LKKRKVNYPKPRTANAPVRGVGLQGDPGRGRSTVATINLGVLAGRDDLAIGDQVRICGGGLYAGELATVASLVGGLIPAATVRTEAGRTRRVRAIDLERIAPEPRNPETSQRTE